MEVASKMHRFVIFPGEKIQLFGQKSKEKYKPRSVITESEFRLRKSALDALIAELTRWRDAGGIKIASFPSPAQAKSAAFELMMNVMHELSPALTKQFKKIEDLLSVDGTLKGRLQAKNLMNALILQMSEEIQKKVEEVRISNLDHRQYLDQNMQLEESNERRRIQGGYLERRMDGSESHNRLG